jgi:apolipoprotein N-acyltransferase
MQRMTSHARGKKAKQASSAAVGTRRLNFGDWYRSTFGQALVSALLLWSALPPLDLGPLAYIAPIWWVLLIRRRELPGRRRYASLWLAGCLFWLAALHWLRLPHWLTGFGWIAMGLYMGFYLPLFVGLARVAVHRLRIPVVLAAPVVWMGLELAQGHFLTGFTMGGLGHTQHRWTQLIQISDLAGVYGVGFVVMFVAACLGRAVPVDGARHTLRPLVPLAVVLGATLLYGHLRMSEPDARIDARILLVQGSVDTVLDPEPDSREKMHGQYYFLTQTAVATYGKDRIGLIVWPETVFYGTLVGRKQIAASANEPDGPAESDPEYRRYLLEQDALVRQLMRSLAKEVDTPLLVGISRKDLTPAEIKSYNSAVLVDRDGVVVGCYDKTHRVVFGEYIPFADAFSWLIPLTPLNSLNITIDAGTEPAAFALDGLWIAPNICYESVLPHLIRSQVNALKGEGREPDILINLTNDGWFWGSSELDMHLACGVFRAVECRKPFLIAANTGFSAWIDGDGRIRAQGPRRATETLLAEVQVDSRTSWYLRYGDIPAGLCLAACAVFAGVGSWDRLRRRRVERRTTDARQKKAGSTG